MKKFLHLAAIAVAVAAIAPAAAFADDPLAAIKTDLAQLKTDVQTKHDTVIADSTVLQNDATSLVGSDRATATAKIKADASKLTHDWRSLLSVCLADRAQLRKDIHAARVGGNGNGSIAPLVHLENLEIRPTNIQMRIAVLRAHAAVVALRPSYRNVGQPVPVIPTPPVTTP